MKKIIAIAALAATMATPAVAEIPVTPDVIMTDDVVTHLNSFVDGYKTVDGTLETGAERVERLLNELGDLADTGGQHGPRWNQIVEAAAKEGWSTYAASHIKSFGLLPNVSEFNAWNEYFLANPDAFLALIPAADESLYTDIQNTKEFSAGTQTTTTTILEATENNQAQMTIGGGTYKLGDGDTIGVTVNAVDVMAADLNSAVNEAVNTALKQAVEAAFNTGYDEGYEDGFRDGWQAAETHYGVGQ